MGILVCIVLLYAFFAFYSNNVDATTVTAKPSLPPCNLPARSLDADVSYEPFHNACPAPTAVELTRPRPITETAATIGLAPTPQPRSRERKTKANQVGSEGSYPLPKRRTIVTKKTPEVSWPTFGSTVRVEDPDFPKDIYEVLRRTYELSRPKQFHDTAARPPHNRITMSPDPSNGHDFRHDAFPAARSDVPKDMTAARWPVFGSEEFWASLGDMFRAPDVDINTGEILDGASDHALERSRTKPSLPDNSVSKSLGPFEGQELISAQQRQMDALPDSSKSPGPMTIYDFHEAHHREKNAMQNEMGLLRLRCWFETEASPFPAPGGIAESCARLRRAERGQHEAVDKIAEQYALLIKRQ
ncbi:hypothetical protein MTO96_041398 [Rhipicephalus appendiculatus]